MAPLLSPYRAKDVGGTVWNLPNGKKENCFSLLKMNEIMMATITLPGIW